MICSVGRVELYVRHIEEFMITLEILQEKGLQEASPSFATFEETSLYNTRKVLAAFKKCRVSDYHFKGTTGYGYDDSGRETLDQVFAEVFKGEAGLVRPHFVSGTHALATTLMSLLGMGENGRGIVSAVGRPYDTMQSVIGLTGDRKDTLLKRGFTYTEVPVKNNHYDITKLAEAITEDTRVVLIQRSRGYSNRLALSIEDIRQIVSTVKAINPNAICFVDNCYGEFTEKEEPLEAGADIIAGSLIKNAGGGIAPTGGYVVGKADLVEGVAEYLTAPGLGSHMGSYAPGYRLFFQGLFLAPHVVAQALKGAAFTASVAKQMGYEVFPDVNAKRYDLIQAITLNDAKEMEYFCQGMQSFSPVDAFARPVPGELPGYTDPIIMACGAFVQGSSIELSADGPMRPPYTIYMQGGLVFEHSMLGILGAVEEILKHREGKESL